ncbi:MAG TPA: hypothetical protein VK474_12000 [Chthoniobacterales bacterium]|nr:hypothetical protein [Chthoniobacterales bacterium]
MGRECVLPLEEPEKLVALREVDQYRRWASLRDQRRCLQCGRLITGHEIKIVISDDGHGPLRGLCPTSGCASIPMDWVLPRDAYFTIPGADEEAVNSPAASP